MNFGEFFKTLREKRGISLRLMADILEVSPTYIFDLEHNNRKITKYIVDKLICCIELTEKETEDIYDIYAIEREIYIPEDVINYLVDNNLIEVLRKLKRKDPKGESIKKLLKK